MGSSLLVPKVLPENIDLQEMLGVHGAVTSIDMSNAHDLYWYMIDGPLSAAQLEARIAELTAEFGATAGEPARSKHHVLLDILGSKYWKSYLYAEEQDAAKNRVVDPLEKFRRLLVVTNIVAPRTQISYCGTCPFSGDCAFAKKFQQSLAKEGFGGRMYLSKNSLSLMVTAATKIICEMYNEAVKSADMGLKLPDGRTFDPDTMTEFDYLPETNDGCPAPPFAGNLDRAAQIAIMLDDPLLHDALVRKRGEILDWNDFGEVGKNDERFDPALSGTYLAAPEQYEKFFKTASPEVMAMLNLIGRFGKILEAGIGEDYRDTEQSIRENVDMRTVQEAEQIRKMDRKALESREGEAFDVAYHTGSLEYVQNQERSRKQSLFYVLVDISGSMSATISQNKFGFLMRFNVACALAVAIAHRQWKTNNLFYFRFFNDDPMDLKVADSHGSYVSLVHTLLLVSQGTGGTRVNRALATAHKDIQDAQDALSKAEVVLITDGDDDELDYGMFRKLASDSGVHYFETGDKREPDKGSDAYLGAVNVLGMGFNSATSITNLSYAVCDPSSGPPPSGQTLGEWERAHQFADFDKLFETNAHATMARHVAVQDFIDVINDAKAGRRISGPMFFRVPFSLWGTSDIVINGLTLDKAAHALAE